MSISKGRTDVWEEYVVSIFRVSVEQGTSTKWTVTPGLAHEEPLTTGQWKRECQT
jgi:hypothetical protein